MKCKVCGAEMELTNTNHYLSRNNEACGLALFSKKEEVTIYDTFDCKMCGCQNVVQERKRKLILTPEVPSSKVEEKESKGHNECKDGYCSEEQIEECLTRATKDKSEAKTDWGDGSEDEL